MGIQHVASADLPVSEPTVTDRYGLVAPVTAKSLEMQPSDNNRVLPIPRCVERGHVMVESGCKSGGYKHGWSCGQCDEYFLPGQSERWHCAECSDDLYFGCW